MPHALNVNQALFDAITSAAPGALARDAAHDLALTTCVVGVSEPVEAYTLARGARLELVGTDGTVARSWSSVAVFVKRTPAAARRCGGIGTWTAPAAQMAASFFAEMGALVFDPISARVWVRAD